jgi:hypothetical protein
VDEASELGFSFSFGGTGNWTQSHLGYTPDPFIIDWLIFFFPLLVLGLELRVCNLSHSTSPFFDDGFFFLR